MKKAKVFILIAAILATAFYAGAAERVINGKRITESDEHVVTGDQSVGGNQTVGGNSTVSGNQVSGKTVFLSSPAFTALDTTPNVSTSSHWITADTTTYTDFDGTPVDGQQLWIYCKHAATFDLTSSGIEADNRTSDYTATVGFVAVLIYEDDDSQWHLVNAPPDNPSFESVSMLSRSTTGFPPEMQ